MTQSTLRTLTLLAALLTCGIAGAAPLDQPFDRTVDLRPGAKVTLDNTNGSVTVRAWDQPRVRIHAIKHAESRDDDAAKKGLNDTRIEVTASASELRIHTVMPARNDGVFDWIAGTAVSTSVSYVIDVPRTVGLSVETVNGHIEANGVHGTTHLSTTNGRIDAMRCGGTLDASTTNGRITAELLDVAPGHRISLETTNGRIALTVPKALAARVDASTSHGSINSDIPITGMNNSERHALRGTLNGGGSGELHLRTTNGSIEIRGI